MNRQAVSFGLLNLVIEFTYLGYYDLALRAAKSFQAQFNGDKSAGQFAKKLGTLASAEKNGTEAAKEIVLRSFDLAARAFGKQTTLFVKLVGAMVQRIDRRKDLPNPTLTLMQAVDMLPTTKYVFPTGLAGSLYALVAATVFSAPDTPLTDASETLAREQLTQVFDKDNVVEVYTLISRVKRLVAVLEKSGSVLSIGELRKMLQAASLEPWEWDASGKGAFVEPLRDLKKSIAVVKTELSEKYPRSTEEEIAAFGERMDLLFERLVDYAQQCAEQKQNPVSSVLA
jgi:hypothetical protein